MTTDVTTLDVSRLAVVRVHTFEVGKHDVTVERMPMLRAGVLDDRVRDCLLVVASEVGAAPRASLLVSHDRRRYRLDGIATSVDGSNGPFQSIGGRSTGARATAADRCAGQLTRDRAIGARATTVADGGRARDARQPTSNPGGIGSSLHSGACRDCLRSTRLSRWAT